MSFFWRWFGFWYLLLLIWLLLVLLILWFALEKGNAMTNLFTIRKMCYSTKSPWKYIFAAITKPSIHSHIEVRWQFRCPWEYIPFNSCPFYILRMVWTHFLLDKSVCSHSYYSLLFFCCVKTFESLRVRVTN